MSSAFPLRHRRVILFLAVVAILLSAIPVLKRPIEFLVDDAFFYPQVASLIVRTGQSTFNGITITNGYHPLWMVVNVLVMSLTHGNRWPGLHLLLGLEILLVVGIIWQYLNLNERLGLSSSVVGLGLLIAVCATSFWGMESHLAQFLLVASLLQMVRSLQRGTAGNYLLLGLLTGLTTLARLDDVFFAICILSFTAFATRDVTNAIKNLVLAGVTFTPLMLLFAGTEYRLFGHIMPVSGAIKSSFPHPNLALSHLGPLGLLCVLLAIVGLVIASTTQASSLRTVLLATCTGNILQAIYTSSFTRDDSTRSFWYYASALIVSALVLDTLVTLAYRRIPRALQLAIPYAMVLVVFGGAARSWLKLQGLNFNPLNKQMLRQSSGKNGLRFEEQLANYIATQLPKGTSVAVVDFPGRLAFLTDAKIFPLDGLIADYSYNRDLVKEGAATYFHDHGIRYYLGPVCDGTSTCNYSYFIQGKPEPDGQEVEVISPLLRTSGGSLDLKKKDLLVDVNSAYGTTLGHGHLALWQLTK